MAKTLEEALKLADEAVENGYLNKYPQACIVLAAEVRRLKGKRKKPEGAPKCCVCLTTENLYKNTDGTYRCNDAHCMCY